MVNTSQIIKSIGRGKLLARLGVVSSSISRAEKDGKFPASWFAVIRDLCRENKIDPPSDNLFAFKSPANSVPGGGKSQKIQLEP